MNFTAFIFNSYMYRIIFRYRDYFGKRLVI